MDAQEQIQGFQDFIETSLKEALIEQLKKDKKFLIFDAAELQKFSPDLVDDLLEKPEDTIKAAEIAIEQFDMLGEVRGFKARFANLPASVKSMIRNIRAKHLDKLLLIEGTVRQKSDVRPQVTSARFECPSCGTLINVLQLEQKFREPGMCGCGRKGKFRLLEKEMVDAQGIVLEEASEDLEGGEQPKRINLLLKNDLVSPISEKKTNPGSRIRCAGILKEVPVLARDGGKLIRFDLMIEANSVEAIEEDFSTLEISPEEEEEILNISRDPDLNNKLISSVAPSIYGHEKIKEAVLMLMAGGVRKVRDDGSVTRGDIHVLLIGDPGSGKCLHESTKVMLGNGDIVPIQELSGGSFISLPESFVVPSLQLDGSLEKSFATKVWKRKSDENLLRIKTRIGKELWVTKDHPLFYCDDGYIIGKEARKFSVGERIATPRKIAVSGALQMIPIFTPTYARNSHRLIFPAIVTGDLARLCGYLCGDGYLAYSKSSGELSITNNDADTLQDFTSLMRGIFHADVKAKKTYHGKTAQERCVNSKALLGFYQQNFPELLGGAKNKKIPHVILRSRNEVLAEFIRGLFECDGHININKRQIEYCTISKALADEIQYSLLRFGIVSLLKKKLKCATNSKERRMVECYELIISGAFADAYLEKIGFVSGRRRNKVTELKRAFTTHNTNIDLIPGINGLLKRIRNEEGLLQKEMGLTRSSYCHFDQNNRLPSVRTVQKMCMHLKGRKNKSVQLLEQIAFADIFWDEILSIEEVKNETAFVYDLEVAATHNFVANGVVVHNSATLKRVAKIAPKGRFVSGKGASGAGLCIAPDSLLCTNPGGIEAIGKVVESRLTRPEEVRNGIWKQEHITDINVQSMSPDLKLHSQHPAAIWKLRAPDFLYEITLRGGKRIKMTANTQLYTLEKGKAQWRKSCELSEGTYAATPRMLIGGDIEILHPSQLIKSNPAVYGVKRIVNEATRALTRHYGTLRAAARHLGVAEGALYPYWRKEGARGNIRLNDFKKICAAAEIDWRPYVTQVALEKGKTHLLPETMDKGFLYVAGMIAGDGDIHKKGSSYSIRLSGSEPTLHQAYRNLLARMRLNYDIQSGSAARPEATRAHSKIFAELLGSLGIPPSPKSHRLEFGSRLLHLSNELLAGYISGLYDTDGSVQIREDGSDCISYTSASERFARQLQLVMLRYGIHATIRNRKPSLGHIKGRYVKWEVEIRGAGQIGNFASHFKLRHPKKNAILRKIITKARTENTNTDVIPGIAVRIKEALQIEKIPLRKAGWHHNLSRDRALRLVKMLRSPPPDLLQLVQSDIYWEPIKTIRKIRSESPYVYDLTVENSHNFVSEGILVHNTAAVVKDEFMSGWSLEAGALVLGNRGVVCIDELDKMSTEDRDAMHEALEGQSYHPDTEMTFADGSVEKIGTFVDRLMEAGKVVKGVDTDFLFDEDVKLASTDFHKNFIASSQRISRHSAPEYFYEISYSHGRKIKVTPEHPVFVWHEGRIRELPAALIAPGMLAPAPTVLPATTRKVTLKSIPESDPRHKKIKFPESMTLELGSLLGYIATEGHSYHNKKLRYAEIGVSNTDTDIVKEAQHLFTAIFKTSINTNLQRKETRKKATKDLFTVRCCSQPLHSFLKENFPELMHKAPQKRVPTAIRTSAKEIQLAFLHAAFKGDGFVDSSDVGYSTSSYGCAKDYQDLLLQHGIWSAIREEKRGENSYYKVWVSGRKSRKSFLNLIVRDDRRKARVEKLCGIGERKRNERDPVPPELVKRVKDLSSELGLDTGYFYKILASDQNSTREVVRETLLKIEKKMTAAKNSFDSKSSRMLRRNCRIEAKTLSSKLNLSPSALYYAEGHQQSSCYALLWDETKFLAEEKIRRLEQELRQLSRLISSEIRFVRITDIKRVPNEGVPYVYDVTVMPHQTFLSEGLVLHNTVTISKANIQATLRSETTVLAAANPKFGRFDPYEIIPKQIELPSTLINRFDLIFPVRDLPNKEKDDKISGFMLHLHQSPEFVVPSIDGRLLRKYFAYARQRVFPKLSDDAVKEIQRYYLKMRSSGSEEGGIKAIPISARQLEALIRMSEASARLALRDTVTEEDAKRAVELMHYCLSQIGIDPETGAIDIDRISTGISASERSHIATIKDIIVELEKEVGKTIPLDDILDQARSKGFSEDQVDETLQKLKRAGDIFEPRRGFISRI